MLDLRNEENLRLLYLLLVSGKLQICLNGDDVCSKKFEQHKTIMSTATRCEAIQNSINNHSVSFKKFGQIDAKINLET